MAAAHPPDVFGIARRYDNENAIEMAAMEAMYAGYNPEHMVEIRTVDGRILVRDNPEGTYSLRRGLPFLKQFDDEYFVQFEGNIPLGNLRLALYGLDGRNVLVRNNELLELADMSCTILNSIVFDNCPNLRCMRSCHGTVCTLVNCVGIQRHTVRQADLPPLPTDDNDRDARRAVITTEFAYNYDGAQPVRIQMEQDTDFAVISRTDQMDGHVPLSRALALAAAAGVQEIYLVGRLRLGNLMMVMAAADALEVARNGDLFVVDTSASTVESVTIKRCTRLHTVRVGNDCGLVVQRSMIAQQLLEIPTLSCPAGNTSMVSVDFSWVRDIHNFSECTSLRHTPRLRRLPRPIGPESRITVEIGCGMLPLPASLYDQRSRPALPLFWPEICEGDYITGLHPAPPTVAQARETWAMVERRVLPRLEGEGDELYNIRRTGTFPLQRFTYIYDEHEFPQMIFFGSMQQLNQAIDDVDNIDHWQAVRCREGLQAIEQAVQQMRQDAAVLAMSIGRLNVARAATPNAQRISTEVTSLVLAHAMRLPRRPDAQPPGQQ